MLLVNVIQLFVTYSYCIDLERICAIERNVSWMFKTQFTHLLLILQAKYMAFHVLGALSQPSGYQEVFPHSTVKSIVLNSYKGGFLQY